MCFLWSKVLLCEMSRNTSGHKMSQVDCLITSSILFRKIPKSSQRHFWKWLTCILTRLAFIFPLSALDWQDSHTTVGAFQSAKFTLLFIPAAAYCQQYQLLSNIIYTSCSTGSPNCAGNTSAFAGFKLIIAFGVCSFRLIQTRITQIWCHNGINESLFRWEFSASFDPPSSKSSGIIQ